MRIVSTDFDGTFTKPEVQQFMKELMDKGFRVVVTTARNPSTVYRYKGEVVTDNDWNKDLFKLTDSYGIPREDIIFCSNQCKSKFFPLGTLLHLDDDSIELENLIEDNYFHGVDVTRSDWKKQCMYKLY